MTVTLVADGSIGTTFTATANAAAAIDLTVGASLPEVSAKLAAQVKLSVPSPSFDISAQATVAATNLTNLTSQLAAMPGGAALATTLTTAVSTLLAAQVAIQGFASALSADIDAAIGAVFGIKGSISAGVSGPNINLGTVSAQIALLGTLKAQLEAQASLAASINATLGVSGLRVYRFDGDISVAGAELQAAITSSGLTGQFSFVVMLPTSPSAWSALQGVIAT